MFLCKISMKISWYEQVDGKRMMVMAERVVECSEMVCIRLG